MMFSLVLVSTERRWSTNWMQTSLLVASERLQQHLLMGWDCTLAYAVLRVTI